MKRFYKASTTRPADGGEDGQFEVLLDGKPIRTPGRQRLLLPGAPAADALAAEWAAQEETIKPDRMPLTRMANTVVDRMPARRGDALAELAGYIDAELLCYRSAEPPALLQRQAEQWQPWLDWAASELSAPLISTESVEPIAQPDASRRALEQAAEALDDWRLVGLHGATRLTGSLVLGFAMARRRIAADEVFALGMLEELFACERWGVEAEQARRHAALKAELDATTTWFALF